MVLKSIIISMIGIGVVFIFLTIIYLLLLSFKYLFNNKDKREGKEERLNTEEIISILTALNHYYNGDLKDKKIIINKLGRV